MPGIFDVLIAMLLVAAAGYAHARLAHHTATRRQSSVARALLLATGIGLGWVTLAWIPDAPQTVKAVGFLSAFGLVHVPAAVILFIKRRRGVYQ